MDNLAKKLLPESEIGAFQTTLDALKARQDWLPLREFLKEKSELYPDDYYILTELSSICYLTNHPQEALNAAQKAKDLEPDDDVLVSYNLGMALSLNEMYLEAIENFDTILSMSIDDIAYGEHGEGRKWAQSIYNDSLYMKGVCYMELGKGEDAKKCLISHLSNRRKGLYSDFSRKQVLRRLRMLD